MAARHGVTLLPVTPWHPRYGSTQPAQVGAAPLQLNLTGATLPRSKFSVPIATKDGVWVFSLDQRSEGSLTRFAVMARLYRGSRFKLMHQAAIPELQSRKHSYLVWHARHLAKMGVQDATATDASPHVDPCLLELLVERKSLSTHTMTSLHWRVHVACAHAQLRVVRMTPVHAGGGTSRRRLSPDSGGLLLFYPPTRQLRLSSVLSKDPLRPADYWGKYLFAFLLNGTEVQPTFDAHVDYATDKGHLLHWLHPIGPRRLRAIFSVRTMPHGKSVYSLYQAVTEDLATFTQTQPLDVVGGAQQHAGVGAARAMPSRWHCYPSLFEHNGELLATVNQDDFGKAAPALVGRIVAVPSRPTGQGPDAPRDRWRSLRMR